MKKKSWKEINQACNTSIMYIIFLFFFFKKKCFNMTYCFFCLYYQGKKAVKIFDRLKSGVFVSC